MNQKQHHTQQDTFMAVSELRAMMLELHGQVLQRIDDSEAKLETSIQNAVGELAMVAAKGFEGQEKRMDTLESKLQKVENNLEEFKIETAANFKKVDNRLGAVESNLDDFKEETARNFRKSKLGFV